MVLEAAKITYNVNIGVLFSKRIEVSVYEAQPSRRKVIFSPAQ